MKRAVASVLLAGPLLLGGLCRAEEIRIEGGATTLSSEFMAIKEHYEEETGDRLSVVPSSAVAGLIALEAGRVDIAAGAHPLQDLIAAAAKEGATIDPATLVTTPIEENRLVAITYKTNPVKRVTLEQLRGIYTGRIRNWRELGGDDEEIDPVWGTETKGQNQQVSRVVLDGAQLREDLREVTGYSSIVNLVRVLPSAIGIVPGGLVSPAVHELDTPPITSPEYLITKGKPSPKAQRFIDFYLRESAFLRDAPAPGAPPAAAQRP